MTVAVELMRQRGFFLGGVFPRWFGADGIMLQQVIGKQPDYEGIKLYTNSAKDLWPSFGKTVTLSLAETVGYKGADSLSCRPCCLSDNGIRLCFFNDKIRIPPS